GLALAGGESWRLAQPVRVIDRHGDGRPGTWRHFDVRGQVTEVDVDTNFDGRPDVEEYYERGLLVRRESDRNFNGQADLIEEFDAETHARTRSIVDLDYDGTADLLLLFRDGQLVFSKRAPLAASGTIDRDGPGNHQRSVSHLAPLADPFESDLTIRATHAVAQDEDCIGLSTSGGLPRPRVTSFGQLSPTVRPVSPDGLPDTLPLLLPRSPRGPPLS